MIAGSQAIADDRRRSQTIAEDRTWFYLLRSSAITISGSQTIANDRRSGFPYDRRRSQNFLRSAICDSRSSAIIWAYMIAGSQTIADDRRRSQKIEHGSILCDRPRSRSQDRRRSQTIAEVGFHMIADDRRTFCDLRSAIRDRLRSYGNQP